MQSKRINTGILAIMLMVPIMLCAQNNTYSPYSRYGLGDIYRKPFDPYRAMGGTSIGLRIPNTINFNNPASYSSQDSMSFIFDFGLRYSNDVYQTSDMSHQVGNSNIDHLAISFPITGWWYSSVGLFPYSNVGYEVFETTVTGGSTINHSYLGNGGLNQFYFGNAFVPVKNLSIGFNMSFLFGNIQYKRIITSPEPTFIRTEEIRTSQIRDMFLTAGIQYTYELNKNKYTLGLSFDNSKKMNTIDDYSVISWISGLYWDSDYNDTVDAYISDTVLYSTDQKGYIKLPNNIGVGFSFNHDDKLIFGIDYSTQQWSSYEFSGRDESFKDSHFFSCGFSYIPNPKSIDSYFELVSYRLGGHYYKTNLNLNNTDITDYGISLGLGMPMRNRKTKVNLTYEFGVKGTTDNGLIKQNYNIISLSLSFYDRWFVKRKFD